MNEDLKQNYIKTFESIEMDAALKEALLSFVNTYDGNNEKETHTLLVNLIKVLVESEDMKIKAEGYDELVKLNEKYDEQLNDIVEAAQIVKGERRQIAPAVPSRE